MQELCTALSFINKTKCIFSLSVTVPPLSPSLASYSNHTVHSVSCCVLVLHFMRRNPNRSSVIEVNKTFRTLKQEVC